MASHHFRLHNIAENFRIMFHFFPHPIRWPGYTSISETNNNSENLKHKKDSISWTIYPDPCLLLLLGLFFFIAKKITELLTSP